MSSKNISQPRGPFKRYPNDLYIPIANLRTKRGPTRTSVNHTEKMIWLNDWLEQAVTRGHLDLVRGGGLIDGGGTDPGNDLTIGAGGALYVPAEQWGNVFFVSENGDNAAAKADSNHYMYTDPWTALDDAVAGDVIVLTPGTYTLTDGIAAADADNGNLAAKNVIYYLMEGAELIDDTTPANNYTLFEGDTANTEIKVYGPGKITLNSTDSAGQAIFKARTDVAGVTVDVDINEVDCTGLVLNSEFAESIRININKVSQRDHIGFLVYTLETTGNSINIGQADVNTGDTDDTTWDFMRFGNPGGTSAWSAGGMSVNVGSLRTGHSGLEGCFSVQDLVDSNLTVNVGSAVMELPSQAVAGDMQTTWSSNGGTVTPTLGPQVFTSQYLFGVEDLDNSQVTLNCGSLTSTNRAIILFGDLLNDSQVKINIDTCDTVSQSIFVSTTAVLNNDSVAMISGSYDSDVECVAIPSGSTYTAGVVYCSGRYKTKAGSGAVGRIEVDDSVLFLNAILVTAHTASLDADATGPFAVTCLNTFASADSSAKITDTTLTVDTNLF